MSGRGEPTYFVLLEPQGKGKNPKPERVDVTDQVLSLEYEDTESKSDKLSMTVRNWDLANFDSPVWTPGTRLLVSFGYVGNMGPRRSCKITKVTGFTDLTIEAAGKEADMNTVVRTRKFTNKTRAQVAFDIAKEHGYDPKDIHIEDTEEVEETIVQGGLTDAQFLRRLADIEGYEFFDDVDGLHFHQRQLGQKPVRVFTWYVVGEVKPGEAPSAGDILSVSLESDIFAKPKTKKTGKTKVVGRDPASKKPISSEATEGSVARDKLGALALFFDKKTADFNFQPNQVVEDTRPTTQTNAAAVKREAAGIYRKAQHTAVLLNLNVVGDPQLLAKSVVEVRNISKRLSGNYYVKSVKHKFGSGYTCELKLSSDGVHGGKAGGLKQDSKAKLNGQKAEAGADGKLTTKVTLDPATGAYETNYVDTGGKSSSIDAILNQYGPKKGFL